MTGLERNADVVEMSSYAPLLAHVDAWQWTPNLIWFDNLRRTARQATTCSRCSAPIAAARLLPITQNGEAANGVGGVYSSAALGDGAREAIVKLVNPGDDSRDAVVTLTGRTLDGEATATTLTGESAAENSLAQPARVAPASARFAVSGTKLMRSLPPRSLTVLRVPLASR